MTPEAAIRDYYEALRRGEPLYPYFAESEATVKFGVGEALYGYDDVSEALREQTRTTEDWTVESDRLVVTERDGTATFADEVRLEWTDRESGERRAFDTRWSGALARRGASESGDGERRDGVDGDDAWLFVAMHVSAPRNA